ncbi:MAG TPA: hypothetical protein VF717_06565 [Pyrinomonadaceae bacterium]|jgi:hypothetical protein
MSNSKIIAWAILFFILFLILSTIYMFGDKIDALFYKDCLRSDYPCKTGGGAA